MYNGRLTFGDQYIWGSDDNVEEDDLKVVGEAMRTVHFESGPRRVSVLATGVGKTRVYWVREGDLK
jgi:hypothetical protein